MQLGYERWEPAFFVRSFGKSTVLTWLGHSLTHPATVAAGLVEPYAGRTILCLDTIHHSLQLPAVCL